MLDELIEAAKTGNTAAMLRLIQADPELMHKTAPNGETPLMAALYHGMRGAVDLLLEHGVAVNIFEAAAIGDEDTVSYLLDLAPDLINQTSNDGWTPLHLAALFGAYETVQVLIERGADVNALSRNRLENRPVHAAAAGKRTAIVHLLLEHGADPNARQREGKTPLHQAVEHCDIGMVRLLLDYGADPDIEDHQGKTPVRLAEENGYDEIAALLRSRRSG